MVITKCILHLPFVQCVGAIYQEVGNLVADIAPAINARLFPSLGGTNIREVLYLPPQTFQTQPRYGRYTAVLYF